VPLADITVSRTLNSICGYAAALHPAISLRSG
jgi:hypothetical protein